jgi:hypothetical protein
MLLCVVISSLGKTERFKSLLESLAVQTCREFVVGVCDQSEDGSVSNTVQEFSGEFESFTVTSGRGLSRGRNAVMMRADDRITHFMFPNDTSTLPDTFVADFYERHGDADVLAVSYLDGETPRHVFPASRNGLDEENVWQIIEPGMVLSRTAIDMAGGFDEDLGTGARTPWQSGEGTHLLLSLRGRPVTVHWDPELAVLGVPEDYSLNAPQRRAKLRAYGRGYGYVLSTWDYPLSRRLKAVGGPMLRAVLNKPGGTLLDAVYASTGRAEGVLGGIRDRVRRQANMQHVQGPLRTETGFS